MAATLTFALFVLELGQLLTLSQVNLSDNDLPGKCFPFGSEYVLHFSCLVHSLTRSILFLLGTIPTELAQLTDLKQLRKLQCILTRDLIAHAQSILLFHVARCNPEWCITVGIQRLGLYGSIPTEFSRLTSLVLAFFHLNQLTGSLATRSTLQPFSSLKATSHILFLGWATYANPLY